jgi:predicted nucleic acid-binding Zn finger protein
MTAKEIQKRSERAQQLRVLQVSDTIFFVESAEGKIAYKIILSDEEVSCSCGDFTRNVKSDPDFKCKHLIALFQTDKGQMLQTEFLDKKKAKLDERFITEIEGNEFVKYPGLLDLGHQKGILKIEVDPIQIPTKENANFAVCKATVVSKAGETFIDIGDANPQNCSSRVAKHLLRMASTRAIARALRSYTNIGMTCLEELADFNDVLGNDYRKGKFKVPKKPASKTKTFDKQGKDTPEIDTRKPKAKKAVEQETKESTGSGNKGKTDDSSKSDQPKVSEAQKRAIYNLSRRRGVSVQDLETMALDAYDCELEDLNSKDASAFIRQLQQAA